MQQDFGYTEETPAGAARTRDLSLWLRLSRYTLPYRKQVTAAVLLSLLISAVDLALPYLLKSAIDGFVVSRDQPYDLRIAGLHRLGLFFLGLILVEFSANFLQVMVLEWTGQNVMHNLRQDLFSHLLRLDLAFFNQQPVGRLVTRLTNDIQNMHEMFTSVIITVFNDLVRIVGIFVILFWLDWRLALTMSVFIPLIIANTVWFSHLARTVFRDIRVRMAKLNGFLQEMLSGLAIVQLFSRESRTREEFNQLNADHYASAMKQITIFGIFMPLIEIMSTIAVALIIWRGGGQVLEGRITIGGLVAFLSYMRLFFQPVRELSQKYSIVQSAMASAERLFQLLDARPSLTIPSSPKTLAQLAGRIDFDGVSFSYQDGTPVLRNISLAVAPGETVAVVGPTGSGKTTLINLLERFFDPDQGSIRIDGHDLRDLDPGWLRSRTGLVMQDVLVIPDTVRNNIRLDLDLSDQRLAQVLDQAQLCELIAGLPDGIDTKIGEGGRDLSAGQKQLLSFARVLAGDPRILILDEATSSVDSRTEMLIEKALASALAGRTSIVIAHRLSTVQRADRIVVMEGGRIVQEGTHDSLLAQGGLYRQLIEMQNQGMNKGQQKNGSS